MINKKTVAKVFSWAGYWLFFLVGPASSYFRNSPARPFIVAVVTWVAAGLSFIALVFGYSEIKKPRAAFAIYLIGFAIFVTSILINSYTLFCVGLALTPVSLIWMMAPQIRTALNRLRSDYHRISQQ